MPTTIAINSIVTNELKTKGIGAIEYALTSDHWSEVSLSVNGR